MFALIVHPDNTFCVKMKRLIESEHKNAQIARDLGEAMDKIRSMDFCTVLFSAEFGYQIQRFTDRMNIEKTIIIYTKDNAQKVQRLDFPKVSESASEQTLRKHIC